MGKICYMLFALPVAAFLKQLGGAGYIFFFFLLKWENINKKSELNLFIDFVTGQGTQRQKGTFSILRIQSYQFAE